MHDAQPPKCITLDMDRSVSPTHWDQENTAWNGHFGGKCYHPFFAFNPFGDLERCAQWKGNAHGADGCKKVRAFVIARHKTRDLPRFFRAYEAIATPEL